MFKILENDAEYQRAFRECLENLGYSNIFFQCFDITNNKSKQNCVGGKIFRLIGPPVEEICLCDF